MPSRPLLTPLRTPSALTLTKTTRFRNLYKKLPSPCAPTATISGMTMCRTALCVFMTHVPTCLERQRTTGSALQLLSRALLVLTLGLMIPMSRLRWRPPLIPPLPWLDRLPHRHSLRTDRHRPHRLRTLSTTLERPSLNLPQSSPLLLRHRLHRLLDSSVLARLTKDLKTRKCRGSA
jgi:hypothetical protein